MKLAFKAHVSRTIQRSWAALLTRSEMDVVRFIDTMTVQWGKPYDGYTVDMIRNGIGDIAGTGLSDKTIRTCLKSLREQGFIQCTRVQYGFIIGLNLRHFEETAMLAKPKKERAEDGNVLLKQGKKQSRSVKSTGLRSVIVTDPYIVKEHTYIRDIPKRGETAPSVPKEDVREKYDGIVRAVKKASRSRLEEDAAKGKWEAIWMAAWRDTFPTNPCPRFTRKEYGQVRNLFRTGDITMPGTFLDWAVREWRAIVNACFSWMDGKDGLGGPPDLPSIGFLLRFKDRFYDGWNRRARLHEDARLSNSDRLRRRLVHQGLSFEDADKEVAAKSSIAADTAKSAATLGRLNDMLRTADQRRADRSRIAAQASAPRGEHDGGRNADGANYTDTDCTTLAEHHARDGDLRSSEPGYNGPPSYHSRGRRPGERSGSHSEAGASAYGRSGGVGHSANGGEPRSYNEDAAGHAPTFRTRVRSLAVAPKQPTTVGTYGGGNVHERTNANDPCMDGNALVPGNRRPNRFGLAVRPKGD